jgi:SanA protein
MFSWLKSFIKGLVLLLIVFFVGSNLWVWSAGWNRTYTDANQITPGSVMVLLGAREFIEKTKIPTGSYQPRIDAAVKLCKSGRIKVAVLSGFDDQSWNMARQLRAAGVKCTLVMDPYGWRTIDSVHRAAACYPNQTIVFVSQEWHCDRALWIADRIDLRACAFTADFGEGWRPISYFLRDCLAKPKAVIDWIMGSKLTTNAATNEGNVVFK